MPRNCNSAYVFGIIHYFHSSFLLVMTVVSLVKSSWSYTTVNFTALQEMSFSCKLTVVDLFQNIHFTDTHKMR